MILGRSKIVLVPSSLADFTVSFINIYCVTRYSFIDDLSLSDRT